VDILYIKVELEITWIVCIKRLEVSSMTWLIVEDGVHLLHVEIKLEMMWITSIERLKVSGMI
jgi:hypothetical protein